MQCWKTLTPKDEEAKDEEACLLTIACSCFEGRSLRRSQIALWDRPLPLGYHPFLESYSWFYWPCMSRVTSDGTPNVRPQGLDTERKWQGMALILSACCCRYCSLLTHASQHCWCFFSCNLDGPRVVCYSLHMRIYQRF